MSFFGSFTAYNWGKSLKIKIWDVLLVADEANSFRIDVLFPDWRRSCTTASFSSVQALFGRQVLPFWRSATVCCIFHVLKMVLRLFLLTCMLDSLMKNILVVGGDFLASTVKVPCFGLILLWVPAEVILAKSWVLEQFELNRSGLFVVELSTIRYMSKNLKVQTLKTSRMLKCFFPDTLYKLV